MWVESCLSPSQFIARDDAQSASSPTREMCLKVGAALLEALNTQKYVAVTFTEQELWVLRERVDIYASQGTNTRLGLEIKKKLYEAMLSIDVERGAGAVLAGLSISEGASDGQMSGKEVHDAVARWKQASNTDTGRGDGIGLTGDANKDDAKDGTVDEARA